MWHSVIGQQTVIANENALSWQSWCCDIGEPFPGCTSHENGITRASEIMRWGCEQGWIFSRSPSFMRLGMTKYGVGEMKCTA
ncbi:hypothetical protein BDW71DRAFT_180150 [Aspergillus fruticulosus]